MFTPLSPLTYSAYIVAAPLFSSLRALQYVKPKQRPEPQNLPF
jgi:hypothetical protein